MIPGQEYLPFFLFMATIYFMMWTKMGMLVPTVLLLFFLSAFGGLVSFPFAGMIFWLMVVGMVGFLLYKTFLV